ncbi:MAG TPA: hypothetical protein VLC55_03405 [Burkholderiales bacterium]|nr:hypothetical protein [Burkholderiales bacterium]
MRKLRAFLGLVTLLALVSPPAFADQAATYVEYQRQALRGEREVAVRANVDLTPKEAEAFWPLYREYHAERDRLGDRTYKLIREYADAYNSKRVTDEQAQRWVKEALELDEDRAKLKERYMQKFSTILPGRKFARYYQIETKLDNVINAKLSAEIPLVE